MYMSKTDKLEDFKKRLVDVMLQQDIMGCKSTEGTTFEGVKSIRMYCMDFRDNRESLQKWLDSKDISN